MAFKIPTLQILTITTLIFSTILIALSILTIYWTSDVINHDFSQRGYRWYRGPSWDMDNKRIVILSFDFINENLVLATCGMTVLAGIVGIVGYFSTRNAKPNRANIGLINFFPFLALVFSLLSIIITSARHAIIAKSTCYWEDGYEANNKFKCTRELGVCRIMGYTLDEMHLFGDITETCMKLHRARTMLIPLTAVSAVVLGCGLARMIVLGRKTDEEADERVERLNTE